MDHIMMNHHIIINVKKYRLYDSNGRLLIPINSVSSHTIILSDLNRTYSKERKLTLPMLVTPLKRPRKTTNHERIRQRQRRHCSVWPSSSWKPSDMSSMKLLLGRLVVKDTNNTNSSISS